MQFGHKIVSNQQTFVNDSIHLKLITSIIIETKQLPSYKISSIIIETKQLPSYKISSINRILLNGILILNLLNNQLGF